MTIDEPTADAFDDPRPGDVFQEMYSCWLRVLDVLTSERTNTKVVIWQWNGRGQGQGTIEEFQSQANYGARYEHGVYSVRLHTRGE